MTSPLLPESITEGDSTRDATENLNLKDALDALIESYEELGRSLLLVRT